MTTTIWGVAHARVAATAILVTLPGRLFRATRRLTRTFPTILALASLAVLLAGCCSLFPSLCPPIITQQPQSQIAKVGTPVTFTVVAQHPPPTNAPLFYQWTFNGVPIAGATSSSFTIPSVAFTDTGTYRVIVTGSPPAKSDPAFLSVYSTTTTGNGGSMQTPVAAFISTNTPATSCPHSFNKFYTNYFFNGPNVPPNLRTPAYASPPGVTLNRLQVDTCSPDNSSQNVTAVRIVKNNFSAMLLACDDDGSTGCSVGSLHSSADAALPTEANANGLVRVNVYIKANTIPTGQTTVTINWLYH